MELVKETKEVKVEKKEFFLKRAFNASKNWVKEHKLAATLTVAGLALVGYAGTKVLGGDDPETAETFTETLEDVAETVAETTEE